MAIFPDKRGQEAATSAIGYQFRAADLLTVISARNRSAAQQPPNYFEATGEHYDNQQTWCSAAA
jgi:hypothetical protein